MTTHLAKKSHVNILGDKLVIILWCNNTVLADLTNENEKIPISQIIINTIGLKENANCQTCIKNNIGELHSLNITAREEIETRDKKIELLYDLLQNSYRGN